MTKNWFERNPKKTLGLLLIIALIGLIFGAEKILTYKNRGFGFNYSLPHRAIVLKEYRPSMSLRLQAGILETHHDTLPRKEFLLRIDNDGFIIPSKKYEHPDLILAFLGGSTTECRYVEEEQRFPYLTGVLLERGLAIKVNSYNAARSGNHTLHCLNILLNKVFPLKPNIVVMMHNINDLMILLYEKSYWSPNSARPVILDINREIVANFIKIIRDRWLPNFFMALRDFEKSLRLLRGSKETAENQDEFAAIRGKRLEIDQEALTAEFAMNLQAFIDLCKARRAAPVLLTMASRFKDQPDKIILDSIKKTSLDYAQYRALFEAFNDTIRGKARANHVLLIDLAKEIPPDKEYMYDLVHYNDRGSIKAAEIISGQLQPLVTRMIPQK